MFQRDEQWEDCNDQSFSPDDLDELPCPDDELEDLHMQSDEKYLKCQIIGESASAASLTAYSWKEKPSKRFEENKFSKFITSANKISSSSSLKAAQNLPGIINNRRNLTK